MTADLCESYLSALGEHGLVLRQEGRVHAEAMGVCMSKYYLRFDTFRLFAQIAPGADLEQLLALLAQSAEFKDIILRRAEKKTLNAANHHPDMRFPQKGNLKLAAQKISCLIQAVRRVLEHAPLSYSG